MLHVTQALCMGELAVLSVATEMWVEVLSSSLSRIILLVEVDIQLLSVTLSCYALLGQRRILVLGPLTDTGRPIWCTDCLCRHLRGGLWHKRAGHIVGDVC